MAKVYNIAIAPNGAYTNYSLVLLKSIFRTNSEKKFRIFVLYNSLTEEEKAKLSNFVTAHNSEVEFLYIDGAKYKVFEWKERFSVETYFRLELQDILPSEVERILYLDIDMIVCKDLAELYEMDLEDKYIAACGFSPRCERGDEFNAGMILFDIAKMRENHITFETYVDLAEKLNGNFYQDQGLLNELFGDTGTKYVWKQKYNFTCAFYRKYKVEVLKEMPDFSLEDIVVMHYPGPGIRPWQIQLSEKDMQLLEKKNLSDVAASKGYEIDRLFFEMQKVWWNIAKETPIYEELIESSLPRKIGFYTKLTESLVDSKEYSLGYKLLKNVRTIYNRIRVGG